MLEEQQDVFSRQGWLDWIKLGIGTNGLEMGIYEFKLTLINNRKH